MAQEDIAFNLEVNVGGGAKSLADLKKEFKALQTELSNTKVGTAEYQRTLEKLGAVKDDIGDLRDTISALNPEGKVAAFAKVGSTIASGFAAAQGAAALFGAESEELQKTMLKVQAAMALAEGIKGITAAGDAFKVLNTVMKANPILAIVAAFTALTAGAVLLYNEFFRLDSASEGLAKKLAKVDEEHKHINASIKAQITALSGLKGNEEEILVLKEKGFKLDIERQKLALQVALAKQAEAEASATLEEQLLRASGQEKQADILRFARLKEQRDATKEAIETLKQSIAGLSEFQNIQHQKELDQNKEKSESYKKYLQEKADADKKYNEEFARQLDLTVQSQLENEAADKAKIEEEKALEEQAILDSMALDNERSQVVSEQRIEVNRKTEEQIRAEKQKTTESYINATKQGLQSAQALTDLFFAHQLRQAKGNAEKEKEIRKKQFNVNKAFGIANAVVDGFGAVQKALNNPYPLNLILAVVSGLLAAANVAKIASTKFDDGGSSSGSVDTGSIGASAQAPAIPQPNNTAVQIDDKGQVIDTKPKDQRVYVVETDITDSNKRVANIEETAKL